MSGQCRIFHIAFLLCLSSSRFIASEGLPHPHSPSRQLQLVEPENLPHSLINEGKLIFRQPRVSSPGRSTTHEETMANGYTRVLNTHEDWISGAWVNVFQTAYTYNRAGNLTEETLQRWDALSSVWINQSKSIYNYTDGTLTEVSVQLWGIDAWQDYTTLHYSYDEQRRVIGSLANRWDGTQWVNATNYLLSYNSAGLFCGSSTLSWSGDEWRNVFHDSIAYNESGDIIEKTHEYWYENTWFQLNRQVYYYSNDVLLNTVDQIRENNSWINTQMREYRNEFGQDLVTFDYWWNSENNSWEIRSRYLYEWTGNGFIRETLIQNAILHAQPPSDILDEYPSDTTWQNVNRTTNTYERISEIQPINIFAYSFQLQQNYPNPFNPETEIRFQVSDFGAVTLKVYDVLGREVATLVDEKVNPGEHVARWNANNQPSGIYYYKLTAGSRSETKSMIIVR